MSSRFIFCLLLIFALVPARAKIFAQSSAGTKDSIERRDIYQVLLDEGIDSVLNSLSLRKDLVHIIMDTNNLKFLDGNRPLQMWYGKGDPPQYFYFQTLLIDQCIKNKTIFNATSQEEKGIASIVVKGKLISSQNNKPGIIFSFTRYRKYDLVYDNNVSNESNSFWDSTAKPILVTIGAVAAIALFFLIRG
jgi:hypothetical protein